MYLKRKFNFQKLNFVYNYVSKHVLLTKDIVQNNVRKCVKNDIGWCKII